MLGDKWEYGPTGEGVLELKILVKKLNSPFYNNLSFRDKWQYII